MPELINQGKFGGKIEAPEVEENQPVAKKPVSSSSSSSPKAVANLHMAEITEKLGFVPGSAVKSPAELKQRMALLRDWYKTKNRGSSHANEQDERNSETIQSEKKKARQLEKQKSKDKRKTKKQARGEGEKPDLVGASAKAAAEAALANGEAQDGNFGEITSKELSSSSAKTTSAESIEFGKFKFSTGLAEPLHKEAKKRGRDVELLRKAEAEKEKKKELLEAGNSEAVKDMEWDKMIARADGKKIKDDPLMLKKSIKKKEKKKAKSQATWAEKGKNSEQAKKAKQVDFLRRQEKTLLRGKGNIKQKKGDAAPVPEKLSRKGRAGFEGRKKLTK